MDITLITWLIGLALIALPVASTIPSSLSFSVSAPPSLATITIAGEIFVVDPADIVLDGTTVQPASAGISIDGQVVSADAANDLFVDGTEMLAQPTSSKFASRTASSNTASLSSRNVTFSGSASVSSVTADAASLSVLGGEIAHLAVQEASSLAIQSAGDAGDISASGSTSLVTASSTSSAPLQTPVTSSASLAMTSLLSRTSPAETSPNVQANGLQSQSGSSASLSLSGSTSKIGLVLTGFSASTHSSNSSGIYAVSGASNISQSASPNSQSIYSAATSSYSAVLMPGAQPNTITTGPTLAIPTISLIPTGSVASSQAMLLAGAIFGITKEAKTLSTIIKDDGPKESFISKIKDTDDDILSFLEDIDPPDPPPSYEDACLDGASIFDIFKDLGCLKGGFDEVISDLGDEPPDINKIQTIFDNIGNLAKNLEKEEEDDDDDETSTSKATSQASKTQDSATQGSSTSMRSITPSMTSAVSSRVLSSASTATASMQPFDIDQYPIADPDTSNYSTPDISDQALMAFLGNILSSAVGIGAGPTGFAVVFGSANATANPSSLTSIYSIPTIVRTSLSAPVVSSAAVGADSSGLGGVVGGIQVISTKTASSQTVLASTAATSSSTFRSDVSGELASLGGEIAQIAYQLAATSSSILAAGIRVTSPVSTSTAAVNAGAVGGEIAAIAYQIASASAVSAESANIVLPSPVISSSLAPSPAPPPPTGPKWGIYLGYQVYTWGGANAETDFYYKIWMTDLTINPAGPDYCAPNSWIANVQVNDNADNVPPYPTKDFKFVIPAKIVETAAIDCMWQPSVGNTQPGSMTCDPGETVLCTSPTTTGITCKNDNPDRILPLSQCVLQ